MESEREAGPAGSSLAEALEEARSLEGRDDDSGLNSGKKFALIRELVLRKALVALEEMRLRRLKKGQDVSRGELLTEAILLLCEREAGCKPLVKGTERQR